MTRDFTFTLEGDDAPTLQVLDFRGTEGVSEPYSFDVYLTAPAAEAWRPAAKAWFEAVLGQRATLSFRWFGHVRRVHGIVAQIELAGGAPAQQTFRVVLSSELFKLTQTRQSRVFQGLTTKGIVAKILKEHAIEAVCWESLTEKYRPRNYCVQYRESDYDFVSRLLEEEGIFFFFRHDESRATLCFADATAAFSPIEGEATLPVRAPSGMQRQDESCGGVVLAQAMRPKTVLLGDYAFKKPLLDCSATSKRETELGGCVYEFPGEFVEPELGARLAKVRMEELEATKVSASTTSDCTRLQPGLTFTPQGNANEALDHEFVVLHVAHQGSQPQASERSGGGGQNRYHNAVTLLPADLPFRPPRVTPRPVVLGAHTATVAGPKGETMPQGEEIHTDAHGRVQVRFHWDREGGTGNGASCWIRVAQVGAGAGFGGIDIPRVGQEVLVTFLEGDPDRPIIVGRVYNGVNPVPYALPEHKTRSGFRTSSTGASGGHNELMFEDRSGQELVRIRAQKNLVKNVLADETEHTGGGRSIDVTHTLNIQAADINISAKRIRINGAELTDVKGGVIKLNCD